MNAKHPSGPPMMLGNMRGLGVPYRVVPQPIVPA
jgi:hypothetical protein